MNEQKNLTPELEKRVQQAVDNFMQGMAAASRWWLLLPTCMALTRRWRSALVQASEVE